MSNLLASFGESASTLGVAALQAQNPDWRCPAATERLTAVQWYESYLLPLAESDLVSEVLRLDTTVSEIARGDDDAIFRFVAATAQGEKSTHVADIVIDATGINGDRAWFAEAASDGRTELPES